jgi:imidazolonepropionase-like amidohydrolase
LSFLEYAPFLLAAIAFTTAMTRRRSATHLKPEWRCKRKSDIIFFDKGNEKDHLLGKKKARFDCFFLISPTNKTAKIFMKYLFLVASLVVSSLFGQDLSPQNGVQKSVISYYLIKNATILASPTKTIRNGSILIKNSEIVDVGIDIDAPKGAVIIDCTGKIVIPSFIETYSKIGLEDPHTTVENGRRGRHISSSKKGAYYWNEAIHPEIEASLLYEINEKSNEELLKMGFGIAVTHVQDGIARGSGALVSLGSEDVGKQLLHPAVASYFSFKPGISRQTYPSSQMGSIALLRQTFYDLQWYKNAQEKETNLSLLALEKQMHQPMIFVTEEKWELFRAEKIGKEFDIPFIIMGSGNEYAVLPQLKLSKNSLILPINFPAAFDVKDPYVSKEIPLSELKHWELAPSNPFLLKNSGISFAITSHGSKNADIFWKNLRKAIQRGLTVSEALSALTVEPSKLLKIDQDFGTLEKGKKASFSVYEKNPFEEESKVMEVWLLGEQTVFETSVEHDIRGKYNILLDGKKYPLEINGSLEKLSGKVQTTKQIVDAKTGATKVDTLTPPVFVQLIGNDLTLQFYLDDLNWKGSVNLHAQVNSKLGIFEGDGTLPSGKWIKWSAVKNAKIEADAKEENKTKPTPELIGKVWYPNMAYGCDSLPGKQSIVLKNATLWTNEKEGILKNATLVCDNGKITYAGTGTYKIPQGAKIVDATGKHVTCGIIDEHSHIAISKGVNEGGQSISAEVNIGDVIRPDDISIYRQLAGGVTAAQLLHGSANTIGGQSALIKLKWGHAASEFLIPNAPKFIKCALGENVKQSNFGDGSRFPQTRMGVEQVFYDGFSRAKAYQSEWKNTKPHPKQGVYAPRRDLELDALVEILDGQRFITCHSYVQSEVNMLMHIADSMGFKVNTFTHILEGYKVADKMVQHGVGGSTFADWWAYKFEVNDAIPYNAKMMADQGVVVAINSDDAEMGRRLNQEAAKGVKYGGMSEEDAWKMVTLNPAKLLHLDSRMGSLKEGKDADIVLWTKNPLSIDAKVEMTLVDGEILYEEQRDLLLRNRNREEKARIISKMLESNENGEIKKPFVKRKKMHFHCDTIGEEGSEGENSH